MRKKIAGMAALCLAIVCLLVSGACAQKPSMGIKQEDWEQPEESIKPPAGKYDFYVDGRLLFQKSVYVKDGASMLPVKKIAQELGYIYDYGVFSRMATLTAGAQQYKLEMDLNQYNVAKARLQLETAPKIYDATVYAPVSFFTQCLGLAIELDGSSISIG